MELNLDVQTPTTNGVPKYIIPDGGSKLETVFSYVYKHDFKLVLNTMRDLEKQSHICNLLAHDFVSEVVFTKFEKTWEIGAEFNFLWKGVIKLYYRTLEYYEGSEYAKIKWIVYKTEPVTLDFYMSFTLFKDFTGLFTTVLLSSASLQEYEQTEDDLKRIKLERYVILKNIDRFLEGEGDQKRQKETIYIEADINILWKIISNMKLFQKLVPIICDSVIFDEQNEEIREGTELTLYWNTENGKSSVIFVVKKIIAGDNFCSLVYECKEGNTPVPKQEIVWSIEKKEGDFCFVEFSHHYQEDIKKESLQQTSILKKRLLEGLKKQLEANRESINFLYNILDDSQF
jgi:hypothetical protein